MIKNEDVIKDSRVLDFLCDNGFLEYLKVLSLNEGRRVVTSLFTEIEGKKTYYILIKYQLGNLDLIKGLGKEDLIHKLETELGPFLNILPEEAKMVAEHIREL